MPKLRISEIFTSIQGEGSWVGVPSTFVRVSGCNLRCTWCDTPYASWEPEGPTLEVSEVIARLGDAATHVVVTGGEPMLFDATEDMCRELKAKGHVITIETAGTIYRDIACDLMSISPKLSNSMPFVGQVTSALDREQTGSPSDWPTRHEATRLNIDALSRLIRTYSHQLKFVVNPDADLQRQLEEIIALLDQVKAQPSNVLLMAEGTDSETLHRRERLLVEPCLRYGFRLTPRLHVDLFGNSRGT